MKDVVGRGNAVIGFSIALAILVPSSSSFCQSERHPVNLVLQEGQTVWKDPRGPLTQKAKELGLSPAEVQRIRKNTGYVFCPAFASGGTLASSGSGMLVGNGDLVVTDAHLFIDPETNNRRGPLSDCHFVSQADPPDIVKLDFSSERTYKFYTLTPKAAWYNDRAIVGLAHRVPGANPLPFDLLDTPVKRGDRLIMISANQLQMTIPMPHHDITIRGSQSPYEIELNREPIAQAGAGALAGGGPAPSQEYGLCDLPRKCQRR